MVKTFRQFLEEKRLAEIATVNTQTVTNALGQLLGTGGVATLTPAALARTMLKTPQMASMPVLMAQDPAVQDAVAKLSAKTTKNKPANVQNTNNAVPVTGALPGP